MVGAPFSYIRGPAIVEACCWEALAPLHLIAIAILYSTWLDLSAPPRGLDGSCATKILGPLEFAMHPVRGVGVAPQRARWRRARFDDRPLIVSGDGRVCKIERSAVDTL